MTAVAVATTQVARARRERIRLGMHSFIATRKDIADAYRERDWETLGHASWEAYVEAEFSEDRVRLSAAERREAVAELRLAGLSQRAIGAALGVPKSTVDRDLSTAPDGAVEVTGVNGKTYASTRPTPAPGPVDAALSPSADPGANPGPVAHPSWPTESELKPWETLAPTADRVAESMEPIADDPRDRTHGAEFESYDAAAREPAQSPEPADVPSTAPAGPGSGGEVASAREGDGVAAPPPSALARTPEQVKQMAADAERARSIEHARRIADRLVREVSGFITEIEQGVAYGEPTLVTAAMVAGLREQADRLERHLKEQE